MAVDYRGYGWGTGSPRFSTLCPDADKAADKLPDILQVPPRFLVGTSPIPDGADRNPQVVLDFDRLLPMCCCGSMCI